MNEVQQQPQHAEVVSLKEWLISSLIMIVPIVNLIMILVWAFSSNTNPNKANFFKAQLILMVIGIVLSVIVMIAIAVLMPQTAMVPAPQ
ncbi:hypothetical protein [Neisseria sp.]|uniref:hypothetical protein n=1 Tax=Neisseria sp. TaxID=192066 RepID=UPI00359FE000